jgi:hypothetical protein
LPSVDPYTSIDSPKWWGFRWWAFVPVIVVGIGVILWLSVYYIDPSQNTQFAVTAILAFGTLIVIIVQAVIYRSQWHAMRQSLDKTDGLLAQNDRMLTAVHRQNEHAKAQADSMAEQLDVMRRSLKQADEHFYVANRAQVVLDKDIKFLIPNGLSKQGPNPISVSVLNGGRTAATDVTITSHSIPTRTPFPQLDYERIVQSHRMMGPALLVPNNPVPVIVENITRMTEAEWNNWYGGSYKLFIQLGVWYTDIQDIHRVTFYWYECIRETSALVVIYSKTGIMAKPDLSGLWK